MRCPFCAHEDSQVKDSRPAEDGAAIRRRRQCDRCSARFTTFERVQLREVTVVKSDDRREPFDRRKLEQALSLACRIQRQLETAGENEVSSTRIGELAMEGLRGIDSVAYIRFASVYRDFSEARDFEEFASTVRDAVAD